MKLGIIARSDNTGLGNQTRDLVTMLNPDSIMLVNSLNFNKNKQNGIKDITAFMFVDYPELVILSHLSAV